MNNLIIGALATALALCAVLGTVYGVFAFAQYLTPIVGDKALALSTSIGVVLLGISGLIFMLENRWG